MGYRADAAATAAIATISGPGIAVTQHVSFTSRPTDELWIAFEVPGSSGGMERALDTELRSIGSNLDHVLPLFIAPGTEPVEVLGASTPDAGGPAIPVKANIVDGRLRLQLDKTEGITSVAIDVRNSVGEEAKLLVTLDAPYFPEDRSLAEKRTSLANIYKVAADEAYLTATGQCEGDENGGPCRPYNRAYELYGKALAAIPTCGNATDAGPTACKDEKIMSTWELLRADIQYRRKLIGWGLPFYGGFHRLRPTTPHHELVRMEALLVEMTALMSRLDSQRKNYDAGKVDSADISAEIASALGTQDSRELEISEREREEQFATLDVDSYIERQRELEREIAEFQASLDSLSARQDGLAKQASALTQSAVAAASGIPLSELRAAASGDLEQVAKSFVEQQILAPNSPLAGEIFANSELARGVVEQVGNVRKTVGQLRGFEQQAQVVGQAIKGDRAAIARLVQEYGADDARRLLAQAQTLEATVQEAVAMSRSLDGKRALAFLGSTLSPQQRAEIDRIVNDVKPIERVFEAAYVTLMDGKFQDAQVAEFETQLRNMLDRARPGEAEIGRMRSALKQLVNVDRAVLSDPYFGRQTLVAIDTIERDSRKIVRAVLALDPELMLQQGDVQSIVDRLAPADRLRVVESLRRMRELPSEFVNERSDRVCVRHRQRQACVSFESLRIQFRRKYEKAAAFPLDRMKDFLNENIDELPDHGVLLLYFAKDGAGGFAGNIRTLFKDSPNRLERAWRGIDFDGPLFGTPAVKQSAQVAVAEVLTASQIPSPPVPQVATLPGAGDLTESIGDPSKGGLDPTTNALIQGALNYALPGAGVALQLGQAWAEMDATRELQMDVMKRLSAAIVEQDQLARSKQLATRTAALAGLQRQRAAAVQRAGRLQIEQFRMALRETLDQREFARELMSLYRPRFYYLAEALRERFEAFDRSLADWSEGRPDGGFFKTMILKDPNNSRLALDSEVQLFGWLNRNIEATRTSPYALHHHWERIVGLAREYCTNTGCKPGDGKLGQIGTTELPLLFRDRQGRLAKRDFAAWRADPNRAPFFRQTFSLAPGQGGVPADALNARLLDIAVVPLDEHGRPLQGSVVRLRHEGHSTLVLRDPAKPGEVVQVSHILLPREFLAANRDRLEDVEALRNRFQNQTSSASLLGLRDFEGYGLFGTFTLDVIDGPQAAKIDDLKIMVSYIYTSPRNINSEVDFVARLESEICPKAVTEGADASPLTGVFCNADGIARYQMAVLTSQDTIACEGAPVIRMKLTEPEHVDLLRRSGHVKCLSIDPTTPAPSPTTSFVLDPALMRQKGKCSQKEILMMAASGKNALQCFGERQ
ncbi:hypothetical protein ABU614_06940 [Lysobacter firmicutimachus]|uniref:Uncharacterized protein n=1 Tax=Lysobacter firmicutimachus TaxID=1792846 RepID=A0AAU8MY06_9GAMM